MIEQKFSLELTKNGVQKTIYAKQGEKNARTLSVAFTCNGKVANISEYNTIDVMYDMFDEQGRQYKVTITENEGNPIEFVIPDKACENAEERIFEIRFTKEADVVFSPQFRVIVEANISGPGGETSSPEVDTYVVARTGYDLMSNTDKAKLDGIEAGAQKNPDMTQYALASSVSATQDKIDADHKLSATLVSGLADVATSGSYADLSNKPTLATVATSGNYNDLINKPTFEDNVIVLESTRNGIVIYNGFEVTNAQLNTFISNKKTIFLKRGDSYYSFGCKTPNGYAFYSADYGDSTDATLYIVTISDGVIIDEFTDTIPIQPKITSDNKLSYNLLSDTPTIPTVPTNVSSFTNDAGYLTTHQDISGKADKSYVDTQLLYKQDKLTAGENITIDADGVISASGSGGSPVVEMAESDGVLVKTIDELYADYESGKILTYLNKPILSFNKEYSDGLYQYAFSFLSDEFNPADYTINYSKLVYMIAYEGDNNCQDMYVDTYDMTNPIVDEINDDTTTTLLPNVQAVKGYVDAHSGGGGGIDYSTEEQDTGIKWIDGKNIYQKTYIFSDVASKGSKYVSVEDLNYETVTKFDIVQNVGIKFYSSNTNSGTLTRATIETNLSGTKLLYAYSGIASVSNIYVTVYYTKTT